MKRVALLAGLALLAGPSLAWAASFSIDISPSSGALNLGSTVYTQDHAVGLAAANETAQPASAATGNEVGAGITYDDVTNLLSFDFAYGSGFGFVDLGTAFSNVHFHAPGPVNFPVVNSSAGVIHGLAGFHTPSGPLSGRVTGSVVLTAAQEVDLFDNEIYINVHSTGFGPGEIRGQLVLIPEPSAIILTLLGLTGLAACGRRRRA